VVIERIGSRLVLMTSRKSYVVHLDPEGRPSFRRDPALEGMVSGEAGFVAKLGDDLLVSERGRRIHVYLITDGVLTDVTPPVLRSGDYRVTSAQPDYDGVLWFGTEDGLLRYDPRLE